MQFAATGLPGGERQPWFPRRLRSLPGRFAWSGRLRVTATLPDAAMLPSWCDFDKSFQLTQEQSQERTVVRQRHPCPHYRACCRSCSWRHGNACSCACLATSSSVRGATRCAVLVVLVSLLMHCAAVAAALPSTVDIAAYGFRMARCVSFHSEAQALDRPAIPLHWRVELCLIRPCSMQQCKITGNSSIHSDWLY